MKQSKDLLKNSPGTWHLPKRVNLKLARFIYFLLALALLLTMSGKIPANAQATKDPWTPPFNLSHSGSTSNPVAVRDSNGIMHVIWQDQYRGYVYTRFQDDQWSQPVEEAFPFGEASPILVPGSKGSIHAFWIDGDGSLASTRMSATTQGITWNETQFIAESALSFEVTIDSNDILHVVYVRSIEATDVPAGVYYRQSRDGGTSWTPGKVLYSSPYFRGMDKADANVSIASAEDGQGTRIYAAWDNKHRKQVFFSMSTDSGSSWTDPIEIQGTDASLNYATAYGIKVGAIDNKALLIWQIGDPATGCIQFYQSSSDGGKNWEPPKTMLTDLNSCPQKNNLFFNKDGLIFLMTRVQDQWYLMAWNGRQWSNPQSQRTLTGFIDPETQEMVLYSCQNPILLPDGQMYVIGCDEGDGGDIWVTSTSVNDPNIWFPPAPIWSDPLIVQEASSQITSPAVIADSQGRFHTVWIQPQTSTEVIGRSNPRNVIYYSRYDGLGWSTPVMVVSSPTGDADQPSITIDDKERLMISWREKESGSLYFSWAGAHNAGSASEWAKSISLPAIRSLASSPFLTVGKAGKIYVVYAIPINEDRGIYLTTSTDVGQTWSEPVRIVDAVAAQWEMVDQPQIDITTDSHLRVVWRTFRVIGDNSPLGVSFARSEDDGQSWSQPEAMVEGQVFWSDIFSTGDSAIHLVWQERTFNGFGLRQKVSLDGGQSWSRPATIMSLGSTLVPASLVKGNGDQLYLVLIAKEAVNRAVLKDWIWKGDNWSEDASLDLAIDSSAQVLELNSAIFPQGKLGVVYSQVGTGRVGDEQDVKLLFLDRQIAPAPELPSPTPAQVIKAAETSTPTVESIVTSTPTPMATPSQVEPVQPANPQPAAPLRTRSEMMLGVVLIIMIVGATVGLAVRTILKRRV